MTSDPTPRLRLTGVRAGKAAIAVDINGRVVFRDRVDPDSQLSRVRFLKGLREAIPGLDEHDEAVIVDQLLQLDLTVEEKGGRAGQGRPLELPSPEPWRDPVDGAALLDDLTDAVARYVVVEDGAHEAIALWIVHTYAVDAAEVTPRLGISSPEKRCGKSTLLRLIGALADRPLPVENISAPAVFRSVEAARPTLLVDEADTFLVKRVRGATETNEELRGVLNSGHLRGGFVVRCCGDEAEPRQFNTFAAAAIALIGELPSTLEDRAVMIRMRRRHRGERVAKMRLAQLWKELEPLRCKAKRWAADNMDDLRTADPELPETLHDRAADNWRPLAAIADACGGDWPQTARTTAGMLSGVPPSDDSAGVMLLEDLRQLFASADTDRLATTPILAALTAREDRPWGEWRRGQPLTARGLARLLQPFGAISRTVRLPGNVTAKGYLLEDLREPFERYTSPPPCLPSVTPTQGPSEAGFGRIDIRNDGVPVTDARSAESHMRGGL